VDDLQRRRDAAELPPPLLDRLGVLRGGLVASQLFLELVEL